MKLVSELPDHIKKGQFKVEEEPIVIDMLDGTKKKMKVTSSDAASQVKSAVKEILAASKAELEKQQKISIEIQDICKQELLKANDKIIELKNLVNDSKDAKLLEDTRNSLRLIQAQCQQIENSALLLQKSILDAIAVLIKDREFGPRYFARMRWTNMTKADQALFYLLKAVDQLGNMGTPKGFEKKKGRKKKNEKNK